jgi:hypothetical protein
MKSAKGIAFFWNQSKSIIPRRSLSPVLTRQIPLGTVFKMVVQALENALGVGSI